MLPERATIDSSSISLLSLEYACMVIKKITIHCNLLGTELSLSSRGRMTLGVGTIFWFISHTMSCQPKELGLHIYSWPRQPSICQDVVLRCFPLRCCPSNHHAKDHKDQQYTIMQKITKTNSTRLIPSFSP
jgi:hypothetical protein